MNLRVHNTLLCGMIFLICSGASWGETAVKQLTYHGWQGAYHIENGTVELVYVPQIGRIMRYAYLGGPNMLWENSLLSGQKISEESAAKEWPNYGGDKLWPAPQSRWGWPPDPILDSGSAKVTISPDQHLLVTGQASTKSGVRFTRDIALDASGTGVTIKNTMTNTSDKPLEWSVWEITQVNDPDSTSMPLNTAGHFAQGYHVFSDGGAQPGILEVVNEEVILRRSKTQSFKIGGDSPLVWLQADKGGYHIQVSAAYEAGGNYPDDGCGVEIYTNGDPLKYVELELLSPIRTIAPHESSKFTTYWKLRVRKTPNK